MMLSKIFFLYHDTIPDHGQGNVAITGRAVTGGLSGTGQIFIILIVLALIIWFFWYLKNKKN